MKNYSDFPPLDYFLRVLRNRPEAALTYIKLWAYPTCFKLHKGDIYPELTITPTIFRKHLAQLASVGVLSFSVSGAEYAVEVFKNEKK